MLFFTVVAALWAAGVGTIDFFCFILQKNTRSLIPVSHTDAVELTATTWGQKGTKMISLTRLSE